MSWWLWFEELQNGRGAGVSWWSWWCCWQKVIFLFLTWYVNKYNIHMTCRYYIWYICLYTRSIYTPCVKSCQTGYCFDFLDNATSISAAVSAIHRLARMTIFKLWKSAKHPSPMFLESRESTICVLTAPCQHLQWIFFIWLFSCWLDFQAAG